MQLLRKSMHKPEIIWTHCPICMGRQDHYFDGRYVVCVVCGTKRKGIKYEKDNRICYSVASA